jgi:hypothetical protein
MAADSRILIRRAEERTEGEKQIRVEQQIVFSDNANHLVRLNSVPFGISLYDMSLIGGQPVESFIQRFEADLLNPEDDIDSVGDKLISFLRERQPTASVGMHLAGYRRQGRSNIPVVLVGHTIKETTLRRVNMSEGGEVRYGIVRAGDVSVANRLIDSKSLPVFAAMPLQDAVDYAIHIIRATIDTLRFEPRPPTVGGAIDVLVITPEGTRWVQRKELHGAG